MPAPKGIPIPETRAFRLDERVTILAEPKVGCPQMRE